MILNIQILVTCLFLISSCTFSFKDKPVSLLNYIKANEVV